MKRDLVEILVCPACHGELDLQVTKEEDEVLEGTFTCKNCGQTYPITDGIPDLLPPDFT